MANGGWFFKPTLEQIQNKETFASQKSCINFYLVYGRKILK